MLTNVPQIIAHFSDILIIQVACGEAHSVFLDKWGRVFTCGWNQFGQLGVGKTLQQNFEINMVKRLPKIWKIYTGAAFCFVIAVDGRVFAWGNWEFLNELNIKETYKPMQIGGESNIKNENVIDGQWGSSHAIVITESGQAFGCGNGVIEENCQIIQKK